MEMSLSPLNFTCRSKPGIIPSVFLPPALHAAMHSRQHRVCTSDDRSFIRREKRPWMLFFSPFLTHKLTMYDNQALGLRGKKQKHLWLYVHFFFTFFMILIFFFFNFSFPFRVYFFKEYLLSSLFPEMSLSRFSTCLSNDTPRASFPHSK